MKTINAPLLKNNKMDYLKWSYQAALGIALLFLLSNFVLKDDKIAYVDSAKILNEYKGSADAKKAFQVKSKVWQSNIDTLTNEVQSAIKRYEQSLASMSKKEQELSKQIIQTKQQQLADYQKGIQQNAGEENGKLTQNVVAQINAYLARYGKRHNYKMILIANQSGTIAYAKEGLDITQDVIDGLNNEYPTTKK
jgi:outer membrane protein